MNSEQPQQEQKPKKKSRKWFWIAGGFILLIIIIAAAGGGSEENKNTNVISATNQVEEVNTAAENTNQEAESPTNESVEEEQQQTEAITFVFQEPSKFQKDSAERALAEFVEAWKNQEWSSMKEYTQLTWLNGKDDPAAELEATYGFKTLKGFEITNVNEVSDVTTDITFTVQYEVVTDQVSKKQITARVIKETDAYTPSEDGQWGVNPISTFSEKDVN
ncbi:hypothetical protein KKA15_06680 [Patescibacteria group bacterium]|nr:hypothetical protein [Patescibacteria group bacterium]